MRSLAIAILAVSQTACWGLAAALAAGGSKMVDSKMVESQQQQEAQTRINESLDERVHPWVGKPIDDVIAAWGEPYRVDSEARQYVWREQQSSESLMSSTAVTVDLVLTTDAQGIVTNGDGILTDTRY